METPRDTRSGRDERDHTHDRSVEVAQWVALAGAVVAFLAVTLTGAVVSSTHKWPTVLQFARVYSSWGSVAILVAAFIGVALAVLVYVSARFLSTNRGLGLIMFAAVAVVFGMLGVLLLALPVRSSALTLPRRRASVTCTWPALNPVPVGGVIVAAVGRTALPLHRP